MSAGALDPLHRPSSSAVSWTTGNVSEAIPGVQTPLSFTFWTVPFERTVRGSYSELGVLPRSEARRLPRDADEAALGIFHGWPALNVNLILEVGAGLPGASARDVARNVLGTEDLASLPADRPRRYPVVAVKLPVLAMRLPRRMARHGRRVRATWSAAAKIPPTANEARALLPEVREQFTWALLNHSHATFLSQACYEQLEAVARGAGQAAALSELLSGVGGMLEVGMLQRLWDVAHGTGTMGGFLDEYGYQGPNAGNLASRPWRQDPSQLDPVLETYRGVPPEGAPEALEAQRKQVREAAQERLLAALPPHRRPGARILLRLARRFIPLRETGKSMYLQAGDSARIMIRALGRGLARSGELREPEDVFSLTFDELIGGTPAHASAVIAERRRRYLGYLNGRIPTVFTGTPELTPRQVADADGAGPLRGIGASAGVVEGIARVVADPGAELEPMQPGDILVASATDPSWTTLFLGAGAVVIDLGGNLSHGAIVARELGIPCVANAGRATETIKTGDRVRVDGGRGTVTVLESVLERAGAAGGG